jgi:hypothetical protein
MLYFFMISAHSLRPSPSHLHSQPLDSIYPSRFQIACALFPKNTRSGVVTGIAGRQLISARFLFPSTFNSRLFDSFSSLFALFCLRVFHNSFAINLFRTLF